MKFWDEFVERGGIFSVVATGCAGIALLLNLSLSSNASKINTLENEKKQIITELFDKNYKAIETVANTSIDNASIDNNSDNLCTYIEDNNILNKLNIVDEKIDKTKQTTDVERIARDILVGFSASAYMTASALNGAYQDESQEK